MNIRELIKQEESENLEFKQSSSEWKEIIKTVSSFANTKGGNILVGISDRREIVGFQIGKKTMEDLANKIKENTDPKIFPSMSVEHINGKDTILIKVEEGKSKPVFAFDRAYKRVGRSTVRASSNEIRNLALEGRRVCWDGQVCEAALEDVDKEKVKWFLKRVKYERKLDVDQNTPLKEALERLRLMKNGKLTNAAVLLFGKDPQNFFLQAETRCGRFKGLNVTEPFIDMKVIGENLFDQVDEAEKFILRNISRAAWIEPGKIERQEKWEYPPDAIREAIVNAICHRDYESAANVQIRIFDDRIEVWNPGELPEGLTIEKLKGEHESKPRNLLIANLFFLIKYIEQWGTGTNKMIRQCIENGLQEPGFEDTGSSFIVTFRKSKLTDAYLEGLGLTERQGKAIEYLRMHRKLTSREYAKLFGISDRMARNDLNVLIDKKVIVRKGVSDKTAYYVLAEI